MTSRLFLRRSRKAVVPRMSGGRKGPPSFIERLSPPFFIAIQALENSLVTPFIIARGMKMHPLAVIFSMLLCVAAFGVLGVLVATPLVAVANIVHDELYRKRFLPTITDADLDLLAKKSLVEK